MTTTSSTIIDLARDILAQAEIVDAYLKEHNLPHPSFEVDSPTELPLAASVQRARLNLIEKGAALSNLATGAADHLRWQVMNNKFDDTALHFAARFNVFDAVPRHGKISYAELSQKTGCPEGRLRRLMAMNINNHYFTEPEPGYLAHTSNSAFCIDEPQARGWILHNVEEVNPWYSMKLVDSTVKWGDSTNPLHVGPNLKAEEGKEKSFYEVMMEDGDGEWNGVKGQGFRLWRLWGTDKWFMVNGSIRSTDLMRGFEWDKLGKATVVDIGGITGYLATSVAAACPDLTCIVQERHTPWYEERFYADLPKELHGRVSYMPHDKYSEQPIKGAEVYFLATVLHKETDDQVIKILTRIREAMDPKKSRIITRDIIMDGPDYPEEDRVPLAPGEREAGMGPCGIITRLNVSIDLQVLSVMNAEERTRQQYIDLFKKVDPKFTLKRCVTPVGNYAPLMEWVLEE